MAVKFFIVLAELDCYDTNMNTVAYHEINPDTLTETMTQGILRTSQGDKSKDRAIQKTDAFLDTHCPVRITALKLSRSNNLYGYLGDETTLVDISTGERISLAAFSTKSKKSILRLAVDPIRCYVSDLDLYDTIERALELNEQDSTRETLAKHYWNKLIRLDKYEPGSIKRPELMITYDLPPDVIEIIELSS